MRIFSFFPLTQYPHPILLLFLLLIFIYLH